MKWPARCANTGHWRRANVEASSVQAPTPVWCGVTAFTHGIVWAVSAHAARRGSTVSAQLAGPCPLNSSKQNPPPQLTAHSPPLHS
eukprot:361921-Chlamydomonas_euryale.AAC.22